MTLSLVHKDSKGQVELYETDARYHELLSNAYGERFLLYRKAWKEREKQKDTGNFPLSLDFAINSGCQLSCVFCPLSAKPHKKINFISTNLFKKLMTEGKEHSLPAITLGLGSEPLLNLDAPKLINIAYNSGVMDIRLGTNGYALTKKMTDALISSGLTRLELSVDANTQETYASIRKGGDFNKLIEKIEYFLERRAKEASKLPLLRLSFLKLPQNIDELPQFLERWKDKADMISLQNPIGFPGFFVPKKADTLNSCAQPWQRLSVLEDGTLWPCCSFHGEKLLYSLNAKTTSIHNIWKGERIETLRKNILSSTPPEECLNCF
jgi:sulfatase maturation enzyme AslB (radical SAM superfamily)